MRYTRNERLEKATGRKLSLAYYQGVTVERERRMIQRRARIQASAIYYLIGCHYTGLLMGVNSKSSKIAKLAIQDASAARICEELTRRLPMLSKQPVNTDLTWR